MSALLSSSLRPTPEDARSWATSFEKLMKSAAGRSYFRQFLRTEFSEENMMFWLTCEELKKETNKTVVEEKVRQIYEDFISILSPKEVSHCVCDDMGCDDTAEFIRKVITMDFKKCHFNYYLNVTF